MRIRPLLIIAFGLYGFSSSAQYAGDALRFSETTFGGSARIQGIAGAQNSIGADIGNLVGNPAGLGFYRSSDFSITPSLRLGSSETNYLGNYSTDNKDNFNISSLGVVLTQLNQNYTGSATSQGWVSYSFGFGMNRTNNFHSKRSFSGQNLSSSMSQDFAEIGTTDGYVNDGTIFTIGDMAYDGYITNYDPGTDSYFGASSGNQLQLQTDETVGSQNEWTFAFGANYSNKLYLGASLGIATVRYDTHREYQETGINDTLYGLQSFSYNEDLNVSGSGVNFKVGMIFRPVDFIRIGASAQTPNYYNLDESYAESLTSLSDSGGYLSYAPLSSVFSYNLRTPARYNGGVSIFFNKNGFISGDIEYVNYGKMKLDADGGGYSTFEQTNNNEIKETYQSVFNYRIGGEYKIGDVSLRAGYAIYGDPYKQKTIDRSKTSITGGLGYRIEDYYIDIAYVHSYYRSLYSPYFLENGQADPVADTKYQSNSILLTFGARF